MKNIRIGELLVDSGIINEQQLKSALDIQKQSGGKRLGDILIDLGIISEEHLMEALQKRLNVPRIHLQHINIPNEVIREVPERLAREYSVLPVKLQGNVL